MYTLKKSLGQHFLHDRMVIDQIIDLLQLADLKNLLEIGPGGAALTQHLLKLADINFKAVEVDEDKINFLKTKYPGIEGKLLHEDILVSEKPFDDYFSIIGNLPYNISSPILFKILEWEPQVMQVVVMLQKEVAQRIAAKHGNKQYGILSVLMQAFFSVELAIEVDEKSFTPPPNVKSAVINCFNLNNPHQIQDKKKFAMLVKTAFNQRRKTLRNGLKSYYPAEILSQEIFSMRAEQLSVLEFVHLYKNILMHEQA